MLQVWSWGRGRKQPLLECPWGQQGQLGQGRALLPKPWGQMQCLLLQRQPALNALKNALSQPEALRLLESPWGQQMQGQGRALLPKPWGQQGQLLLSQPEALRRQQVAHLWRAPGVRRGEIQLGSPL